MTDRPVGSLVLVGTPIGNLGDLSPRAVEKLRTADVIAAEEVDVLAASRFTNHVCCTLPGSFPSTSTTSRSELSPELSTNSSTGMPSGARKFR